jgi:glycolate oxidase FAD binding subunit
MTASGVPAELATACADVTAAGESDQISGVQARYVAAPASTDEASALLRAAAGLGLTVVPRGSGRRQHWGRPPASCDLIIDTVHLDKVVEHAAGDLIITAQAGVRLSDLHEVTAAARQHLAIGPRTFVEGGTVGGLIATNAADSWRYRYGAPRDLLIGITVVRADGTIARSGGKVVKNVAGYDLGKLFAGSYGTLGLITQATFRLHPEPRVAMGVGVERPDPAAAAATVRDIAQSPLAPSSIDLRWPSAATSIWLIAGLDGDRESVWARANRLHELVGREPLPPLPSDSDRARSLSDAAAADVGRRADQFLADRKNPAMDTGTLVRVAFWVGQLARVLTMIRTAAEANELDPEIEGSAGAGVLNVAVRADAAPGAVARFVTELRAGLASLSAGSVVPSTASAVVLYAPPTVRDAVDLWGPVPSLGLMQAVKDQFDPLRRMAPGRFAGGI